MAMLPDPLLGETEKPLHVGIFTDAYAPQINGVVTSVVSLVQGLRDLGHTVTVVAPQHPKQVYEAGVIRLRSTPYLVQPEMRVALPPSPRKWLQFRRAKFDIVHTHGLNLAMVGWVASRAFDIPAVLTYHTRMRDYIHYYPWYPMMAWFVDEARWYSKRSRLGQRLSHNLRRRLDQNTISIGARVDLWVTGLHDEVIAPAEPIAQELMELGVRTPVRVVHNGIDMAKLQDRGHDPYPKWGIGPQNPRLVTVSRLGKEKSVDALLERFALVYARCPEARLVIIGDGPERANLEDLAERLGVRAATVFTGYVAPQDITDYYHNADMFVFASTSEVHPMVGLEAAACGLPIVARNKMGITKCVIDGETGYLVNVEDAQAFADKVLALLRDPDLHERLSYASLAFAQREWGHKRFAERVLKVYREAIDMRESRVRKGWDDVDDLWGKL